MIPLISVIIPCYKQAQFLSDCLDSLNGQTYENWEAIIVNDGSPDNTRDVALGWCERDSRLRYVEQYNQGACEARNAGLREAKGELIQFLDADDKLEVDKFKVQVEFLSIHPEIDIVFGDACYFTTEQPDLRSFGIYAHGTEKPWIPALWQTPGSPLEKLLTRNLFPINCPLARKKVFKTVGQWNIQLERLQDWEYWIRCAAANITIDFHDAPNSMALIRWHKESMTHDAAKGYRAALVMRIAAGHVIQSPSLRYKNFEIGLSTLRFSNSPKIARQVFRLAYSNFTPKVLRTAARFILLEHFGSNWFIGPFRNWIVKSYRRLIPWPIQNLVSYFKRKIYKGRTPS